jgi:hypothetical protein
MRIRAQLLFFTLVCLLALAAPLVALADNSAGGGH